MQETHRMATQATGGAKGGAAKRTAADPEDGREEVPCKKQKPEADVDMAEADAVPSDATGKPASDGDEERHKLLEEQKEEVGRQRRVGEEQEQLRMLSERREQAEQEVERLRAERKNKGEDSGHQRGAAVFKGLQARRTGDSAFEKLQPPPEATQDLLTQRDRRDQSRSPPPQRGRNAKAS